MNFPKESFTIYLFLNLILPLQQSAYIYLYSFYIKTILKKD